MRIILIAYIFICFIQLNFAQNQKFNSNHIDLIETGEPKQELSIVLNQLAKKENLLLAYESHLLENKFCKVDITGLSLEKSLELVLKDSGLEYKITGNHQLLIRD